jgi:hypothetical protein
MWMKDEPEQEAEALAKCHAEVVVEAPMEVEN